MYHDMGQMWRLMLHTLYYTTHVACNYKTIFFAERGNRTHPYMLEPIPLSTIRTIASVNCQGKLEKSFRKEKKTVIKKSKQGKNLWVFQLLKGLFTQLGIQMLDQIVIYPLGKSS